LHRQTKQRIMNHLYKSNLYLPLAIPVQELKFYMIREVHSS